MKDLPFFLTVDSVTDTYTAPGYSESQDQYGFWPLKFPPGA